MRGSIFAAAGATLVLALATPAAAALGDSRCVWDHLPAEGLQRFERAVAGEDYDINAYIEEPVLEAAFATCGLKGDRAEAAAAAFGAFILEHQFQGEIMTATGLGAADFDQAWKSVDPADADALGKAVNSDEDNGPEVRSLAETVVAQLPASLTRKAPGEALARYVMARATREYLEKSY